MNECNCPDRNDELCQLDINNTNKNKNNTSIISYNDNKHFVKLNECNCPDRNDELCQLDINNTNKNKNNTSIIRQQQPKHGCVAKKTSDINFKRDVKAINDNKHFVKLNECNCPDRNDELCQLDINNTNKNKNNTSIIRQQQPKHGCVAKKTSDINFKRDVKAMLKKFLESAYTEGYFDKVIYVLKDLGKDSGKDSAYLHDKIEMASMKKLNSKCGFLLEALKNDYRDSVCMGVSRNKSVDFVMMLHEYSEKELEEKIRKKQEKWCG